MTGLQLRMTMGVAAAALAVTALTGCGDSKDAKDTPSAPATTGSAAANPGGDTRPAITAVDPCRLLTKQEAGAVMNTTFTTAKQEEKEGERTCDYDSSLVLSVGETTQSKFADDAEGYKAVEGVGDAAYTQSGVIWVRHGNVQISVIANAENLRIAVVKKVIEKIDAGNLPNAAPTS